VTSLYLITTEGLRPVCCQENVFNPCATPMSKAV
jgi:hypothetical protein